MLLSRLALRLTTTAAALLVLTVGLLVVSTPASAASTYTFYVSGSSVGQTSPGVAKDFTLNLTNLNASSSISFNLSIVASPLGWTAQLSQASLTVGPSATQQVTLTVVPPSSALADAVGQYVNVTATPDDNTTAQTVSTTTRVTETFGVSVTVIPQAGTSGDPGQNITWLAYVKNTGNSPQTFTITTNNTSFTSTNLTTNLVTVSPGDTRVIQLTINISGTAPVGTLHSRIQATSTANASVTDAKDFAATVNAKRAVFLSGLTSDDLKAMTEAEASVILRNIIVENRGNVADSYTLQGSANASRHGDWIAFEFSTVSLSAFTQRYLNVTVTVPASITATGDYTVEFRIISDNSTTVIAFLNLTITVTPKHDLRLVYENLVGKQSGDPGTTAAFPVTVSNPGAFEQRVDLTYSGPNPSWVSISATPFSLAAGASRTVYVNFSIPGTQVPTSFNFTLAGTINWTNPYRNRTVDITLEVSQVFDVIASATASASAGFPGDTVSFTVSVRNNGTGPDNFTLSATNTTQAGLVTISPSTVSLALGASQNVTVTVALASAPPPSTGTYYYTITARSSGNSSRASPVGLAVTVNQVYRLNSTVSPAYLTADPGTTVSYTVSVVNNGNGPDSITIQKAGSNLTWGWIAFPVGNGTIPAGGRLNLTVSVSPPSWASEGVTQLSVRVVSDGSGAASNTTWFNISLNPHRQFSLSAASANFPNAHRNTTVTASFTLTNLGNQPDTYALTIAGDDAGWATLGTASYTLNPTESVAFSIPVAIPSDPVNGPHLFTLNATSQMDGNLTVLSSFTVTVNDVLRPELRLPVAAFFAQPYAVVPIPFTLLNNGTIRDSFTVTATARFPSVQVQSYNFTLNAGLSGSNVFSVDVSHPFSGTYSVEFRAVSLTNSSFESIIVATITLEVIRGVDLAAAWDSMIAGPLDTVNYNLTLRNTGNITDSYALSYTAPGPGWAAWFSEWNFTLAPGASVNLTAYIQAPTALASGTYTTTIIAASQTITVPPTRDTAQLRFGVTYSLALTPSATTRSLLPGSTTTFSAELANTGTAADTYTIAPTGTVAAWATITPSVVNLSAGQSTTVSIEVTVPLGEHEGLKSFSVQARSVRSTQNLSTVAYAVTVLKVYGFTVSAPAAPLEVAPGQTGTFVLTVINTGNTVDSFSFVANPQQYVTFAPNDSVLDALQTANITVRFTPPTGAAAGLQSIQVTVFDSSGVTAVVVLNATIRPVYAVGAAGQPFGSFTGRGGPGSQLPYSFNLTNRGNSLDQLNWTVWGEAGPWAATTSGFQLLPAGATAVVTFYVDVPAQATGAVAGTYTLNVTVTSAGGGAGVRAEVAGTLTVDAVPGIAMSLDPTADVPSNDTWVDRVNPGDMTYTFYVRNFGNRPESVTLIRSTLPGGWSASLLVNGQAATSIALAPGEQASAVVRVTAIPAAATDQTVTVRGSVADGLAGTASISVAIHFKPVQLRIVDGSVAVSTASVAAGGTVSVTVQVTNLGNGTATSVQVDLVLDGRTPVNQQTIAVIGPGRTETVELFWTASEADAGTRVLSVELASGASAPGGSVEVSQTSKDFLTKLTSDTDSMLLLGLGLVLGLVVGLAARGGKGKRARGGELAPAAAPPLAEETIMRDLDALGAQGGEGAPAAAAAQGGPPPSGVEHKIVCPNCGTEQWIRGAEGECKTCGVVIEVAEDEPAAGGTSE